MDNKRSLQVKVVGSYNYHLCKKIILKLLAVLISISLSLDLEQGEKG